MIVSMSAKYIITYFVLQSVSPSFHVHLFGVWIIELALTEFTVETNSLALVISNFLNVFMSCNIKYSLMSSYQYIM